MDCLRRHLFGIIHATLASHDRAMQHGFLLMLGVRHGA